MDDRLSVVYSGKGYGKKWKDISNNDPQQKMAVNFVVYALTQNGGIANKILKGKPLHESHLSPDSHSQFL